MGIKEQQALFPPSNQPVAAEFTTVAEGPAVWLRVMPTRVTNPFSLR